MTIHSIASSVNGLPIHCYEIGSGEKHVLIIGGVHGDEIEGVAFSWALLDKVKQNPIANLKVSFIPQFNIDGILNKTRVNARGVDLNRNLPTKDWSKDAFSPRYPPGEFANSEPENQGLTKWLDENKPDFIFSFHSFHKYLLNVNGDCSPIAEEINRQTSYPIEESMGYPTPGCLGTYTGLERKIPTITYELKRDEAIPSLIQQHLLPVYNSLSLILEKK